MHDFQNNYLGLACLAIILIGLIVVWTGYVKHARSAWFMMFIVVWLWAFPLFILPFLSALIHGNIVLTFFETLYDAMSGPGFGRTVVELTLMFSLMVVALVLPIRRFFVAAKAEEPIHRLGHNATVPTPDRDGNARFADFLDREVEKIGALIENRRRLISLVESSDATW